MTFRDLGLIAPILSALEEQGYTRPSPIQEKGCIRNIPGFSTPSRLKI